MGPLTEVLRAHLTRPQALEPELELAPADEIRQRVRERLFVGAAKIADYSGRGSLAGWLQVVTLRIAIDAMREQKARPVVEPTPDDDLRVAGTDPELSLIKERYREPF